MYQLTATQLAWIRSASREERAAFLAKGPAEAVTLRDNKTGEFTYVAALRGVLLQGPGHPDPKVAEADAKAWQDKEIAAAGLLVIDEVGFGIDDVGRDLDERMQNANIVLDWLVPLVGFEEDNVPEVIENLFDDIDVAGILALRDWLPSFVKYTRAETPLPDGGTYDDDVHCILDNPNHRRVTKALNEAFVQAVHDDLAYGCLAMARQPVPTWKGQGASYSWGYTTSKLVYGRNFTTCMDAVITWGEASWNEGRPSKDADSTKAEADAEPASKD